MSHAPRRFLFLAFAAAVSVLGCSHAPQFSATSLRPTGLVDLNPFSMHPVLRVNSSVHGPYRLARLQGTDLDLQMLFPLTKSCDLLTSNQGSVSYVREGVFGALRNDSGDDCRAVGVASLAVWRDRVARRQVGESFPRDTARFRVLHQDARWTLLRGRFRLAGLTNIPGGQDLVAVVPARASCEHPVRQGEASLEFSDTRDVAYRLLSPSGECPVLGFALPPENQNRPSTG